MTTSIQKPRSIADNLHVIPDTEGLAERDYDVYSAAIRRNAVRFLTSTAGTSAATVVTFRTDAPPEAESVPEPKSQKKSLLKRVFGRE